MARPRRKRGRRRKRTCAEVGVWAALRFCQHGRGQAKGLEGAQQPGSAHAVQRGVGDPRRRAVVAHAAEAQARRQAAEVLARHLPRGRAGRGRGAEEGWVQGAHAAHNAGGTRQAPRSLAHERWQPRRSRPHLLQRVIHQRVLVRVFRRQALPAGGAPQRGQLPQRLFLLYRGSDAGIDGGDDLQPGLAGQGS